MRIPRGHSASLCVPSENLCVPFLTGLCVPFLTGLGVPFLTGLSVPFLTGLEGRDNGPELAIK
jgi:hypothetical protein